MMSKKITILAGLFGILILSLACNSKGGPGAGPDTTATQGAAAAEIQDIDVAAFKARMAEKNTVLLDVRTPAETAAGKIEGAMELDVQDDEFRSKLSSLDKEKTYLVYCKAGSRSARACRLMKEEGFTRLYNLKGGYTAWQAANSQ